MSDGVAVDERATVLAESPTAAGSARARLARRILRNRNVVIGGSVFLLLVLIALFAGALSPYSPTRLYPGQRLKPPSMHNFLGTDEFGRDIASLVLHGSRVSLLVGGVTMILTSLGGVVIGLIAGYYRRLDIVIMRVMDGMMAFPAILLAIALMAARGPGVWNVIFALSVVYTPRTAMIIRSTVLSVRELDYVQAARALVGQRDRERQERDPRGALGEPVPRDRPHGRRPEPESPRRRAARFAGPAIAGALDRRGGPRRPPSKL